MVDVRFRLTRGKRAPVGRKEGGLRAQMTAAVEVEGRAGAECVSFPEPELPAASTSDQEAAGICWESPSAGKRKSTAAWT